MLRATGIGECFELVVGGDTLAFKKPDPRVLQHIATTLGYVKMAEDLTGKVGAPFPALPLDLGGPPSRAGAVGPSSAQMAAVINEAATNAAERAGFEPADRLPHRVLSKHVP